MRPKELIMTAFGSYAEETKVNFDEIGNHLYLISGDTGAGKTTIFDAITYALYGVASGQYRDPAMLHSDYVGYDTPTKVVLTFEHGGHIHKVTRTISFSRIQNVKDEDGNPIYNKSPKQKAVYEEYGKTALEVPTAVTNRITEQLGMGEKQFRKIVMLAQGEFRKFLDSDGDERANILDKLFDFGKYEDFQNRIKLALEVLSKETGKYEDEMKTQAKGFRMPDGLTDEEKELYSPDHPSLIDNMTKLIATEEAQLSDSKNDKEKAEEELANATKKLDDGKMFNDKLTRLDAAKNMMSELQGRKADMDSLADSLESAKKAVHIIKPKEDIFRTKSNALDDLLAKKKSAEEELEKKEKAFREAGDAKARAHSENDDRISELDAKSRNLGTTLPQYEAQKSDVAKLGEQEKKLEGLKDRLEKISADQAECQKNHDSNAAALEQLGNVEAELGAAEEKLRKTREDNDKLIGKSGLKAKVLALKDALDDEDKKNKELFDKIKDVGAAKEKYNELYDSFLSNQANKIAADLKLEIEEKGVGVCPVCGTEHHSATVFAGTVTATTLVSQADVDKAKGVLTAEEEKKSKIEIEYNALHGSNEAERRHIVEEAEKLFGGTLDWDTLISDGYLAAKETDYQKRVDSAQEEWDALNHKLKDIEDLKKKIRELAEKKESLQGNYEKVSFERSDLDQKIAALNATIEQRAKGLEFDSIEKAQEELDRVNKDLSGLRKIIRTADEATEAAQKEYAAAQGADEGLGRQIPEAATAKENSKAEYEAVILAEGFASEADYHVALPVDGEKWIRAKDAELKKYDTEYNDTSKEIDMLTEECKGHNMENLADLQAEKDSADSAKKAKEAAYLNLYNMVDNHKLTLDKIIETAGKMAESIVAKEKLERLNTAASGVTGEGGKLSFQRHVMGETFREMLSAANIRLNSMTGGRYEFVHTVEVNSKKAVAGLGIEIMDYQTGKQRSTKGICGGESFQMSMALALGLSDIVQRHSGGQTIDAMFIDEGFGSLSEQALDDAIKSLVDLAGDSRQIGIISHVAKLEECISPKIVVKCSDKGSSLKLQQ